MVFFNYSTMQMAAKVVYYGPGLCGKTTNLHHIYSQTSSECRGEMVSLETETDRTLFFDLLPIDVGQIAGFNTRIQLYTVPGQVFYNTTRKLVLKGVDGIVFVADSQRPMLQANVDSLKNLEQNLGEMGIQLTEVPLVLQFNKRDLDDICTVDELNKELNRSGWPFFEASALLGEGVFETLKGISKFTLLSLKKRLGGDTGRASTATAAPAKAPAKATPPQPKASPAPAPAPAAAPKAQAKPRAPAQAPAQAQAQAQPKATSPPPEAKVRKTSNRNVLEELERLRQEAMGPPSAKSAATRHAAGGNGTGELRRDIQLTLPEKVFRRARRFSVTLEVEDADQKVVEAVRNLRVDLQDTANLEKLLLRLNIALAPKP
jgi:signal recognition particle receptor subunit beta